MKNVTLTARIQIFPTKEQIALFKESSDAFVRACNYLSEEIYKSHELNFNKLNRKYYTYLRETFGLKVQFSQSAIR